MYLLLQETYLHTSTSAYMCVAVLYTDMALSLLLSEH
jgi:hypothetical protein